MFEMSTYAVFMLVGFFVMLMIGIPVAISLAVTGFVFGWLGFGETLFNLLPARFYGIVSGYQWMAIPLFVFMGVMLGVGFHLLNGLFSNLGMINAWPPFMAALTPSLIFLAAAGWLLHYVERR